MEADKNNAKPSKADMVRAYLKSNPKASPSKVAAALKKDGLDVSAKYVGQIRSRDRKSNKGAKGGTNGSRRSGFGPRAFPANSLEEALQVPRALKDHNGGNPWSPEELANALGVSAKVNKFYYLTASSRDYGLTVGTRNSALVELAPLGDSLVYAPSPEDETRMVWEAFFNVSVFKQVYDYYDDGELPDHKYLKNTLESTFNIEPKHHDDFIKVYKSGKQFAEGFGSSGAKQSTSRASGDGTSGPHHVVVGKPAKKTGQVAFVIMPFSEKLDLYSTGFYREVLRSLITPAAVEAGFNVETAMREGSDIIQSTIVKELLAADLVIADLSDHNPNVLFELGLRMAEEKPTALIRAKGTKPIFDVDNMLRVYDYNPNLWKSTLEIDLPKLASHIRATWESRDSAVTYMQLLKG